MLYSELYALTFWIAQALGFIEDTMVGYGLESPWPEAAGETVSHHAGAQEAEVTSTGNGRMARTLVGLA